MNYYEFVKDDFKVVDGWKVFRIRATQDFENAYRNVKKGELGGYTSHNLYNNSWVFGNAIVVNCEIRYNSYIVGDYTYQRIILENSSIQGTGDYINDCGYNNIYNIDVVGHNFIQGSRHSVIWGVNKKTKKIMVSVGCQLYTLNGWKKSYKNIAGNQNYMYHYLNTLDT